LSALAKAYRNAFKLTKSPLKNPELLVSAGPYVVTEASKNGLTLKVNSDNTWMPKGRCETISLVFYEDALSAVSAIKAGDIDLARLVPTSTNSYSSIATALKASKNINSSVVASSEIETVLFNQTSQSSFSSAAFGEPGSEPAVKAALEARQAFLGIISVSKIRALIGANQTIQDANSLVFAPESSYYQASIQDSGISGYQFADAQKSYNTLQKLGFRVPVRVLFDTANPRAQTEYSVLADLASQVGFSLSNVSTDNISDALKVGEYDVYLAPQRLLADQGVSLQKGFYFSKGFPSNSNLLKLMTEHGQATTAVEQALVLKKLDAELISQAYGFPLYQLPTVVASSKKLAKTPVSADGLSLTAGYADWNLASK
jgi:ABC-type transport system substrate-binding protein